MACLFSSCKSFLFGVFIIVASFIPNSADAQCIPTSSDIKRFGTDCQYYCNCVNNEQCNASTGECESGCDFNWVGPACQFKNIAYGQLSRHPDNIDPAKYSYLANDRSLSTCSFTGHANSSRNISPWWTLWLPFSPSFRKLSFVTQTNYLPYFHNFNVSVHNYTIDDFKSKKYLSGGELCYQHYTSVPIKKTVEITCIGEPVGNMLRLQLETTSSQLVLCDFRVYGGCGNGFFGEGCKQICSKTCLKTGQTICDDLNGKCLNGCTDGWKGSRCENACQIGRWGTDCNLTCGKCLSTTCNHVDGVCPNGCVAGYKWTHRCDEECDDKTYGINCSNSCSVNCKNACDKVKGTCSPCQAGWKGSTCTTACQNGTWGTNCNWTCGKCLSTTCNHVDGVCRPNGCVAGYKLTHRCNEECDDKTYGMNCSNSCSVHCKKACDKVTGNCSPCLAGWKGLTCTTGSLYIYQGYKMV